MPTTPSGTSELPRFVNVGNSTTAESSAVHAQRITTARRGPWPMRMSRWCRCSSSRCAKCWPFTKRRTNENAVSMMRHAEDHERDEQRREVEVRLAAERIRRAPADRDHERGHQQAEEHRAGVAHDDARRAEVVRQESRADTDGDRGDERRHVGATEQARLEQPVGVQEHRARGDEHDAGREPVEAVDEVDRVGEQHDADHGDERREIGRQHHELGARERHAEEEHGDAEQRQHAAAEHLPRDLRRR